MKRLAFAISLLVAAPGLAFAQNEDYAPGSYVAGIWVDPDGCQHWVMDLGIEGMMDPVLTRDGKPVCNANLSTLSLAPSQSNKN